MVTVAAQGATPRVRRVNLAGLDTNLVVALRALLEERNVTRAGQRIGLSQPATSAALARLRRHFGDELLSRDSGSYELTALGTVLLDRTRTACEMLERVFASQVQFDPAQEEREFTILASDYRRRVRRPAGRRAALQGTARPSHLPAAARGHRGRRGGPAQHR
jgi:DNA-binding transcriptional LysR family regulator